MVQGGLKQRARKGQKWFRQKNSRAGLVKTGLTFEQRRFRLRSGQWGNPGAAWVVRSTRSLLASFWVSVFQNAQIKSRSFWDMLRHVCDIVNETPLYHFWDNGR